MDDLTKQSHLNAPISRRRVFALGGTIAGGLVVASSPLLTSPLTAAAAPRNIVASSGGSLPVEQIEDIIETTGTLMNGVLALELDRTDLHVIGPGGLQWKPPFELTNEFAFQSLGGGKAILNAEVTLLPKEINPFIDKLFAGGLVLMALHQHFYDEDPQTFHIHYRGIGDPIQLAKAAIAAIKVTGTPLPQPMPSNPKTPLPVKDMAKIIGGTAVISSAGVVTISVPRAETIHLGGVPVKPELGVDVTVAFEPLDNNGKYNGQAACAPDYALIASEVNPALEVSRDQGFEVHCLYNQETDEFPQLYFSHNLATGDPIALSKSVSKVLDKMNVKRS